MNPGLAASRRDRPVRHASGPMRRERWAAAGGGLAAWLVYAAIYAFVFVLSGFSAGMAIRGAIANAVPDGVLALAAIATARRLASRSPDGGPGARDLRRESAGDRPGALVLPHLLVGPMCAALAAALKGLLIWADVTWVRGSGAYKFEGALVAWQFFLSLLTYAAVAGAAHAQTSARRLRLAAEAAERAETLRARAELAALRAQLNPHFLFNVLHSVLGLVRRDPALAEQALERLGDLLRYALHVHRDGVDWASLRQEWEFMESYLDLEKIRLGERLRISLQSDPGALDRLVPSFLLQPLVENAVRHGIAPRAAGGLVRVGARTSGAELTLEIENDGGPSSASDERALGAGGRDSVTLPSSSRPGGCEARGVEVGPPQDNGDRGLGLRLLTERLAALYANRATLASGPTSDGGYRVVITLPEGGGPAGEAEE